MFERNGPSCQSCGMPLSRDELGGGTDADGSRSGEYCSHCFRDGQFIEPGITASEMVSRVEGKLRSMQVPEPVIRQALQGIPSLGRWRTKQESAR